jgi:hypothetical protein
MLTDMVTRGGPGHKEQPEWAVLEGFVNCMKSDDVEAFKALVTSAQKNLRPNVAKGKDPPIWESWYRCVGAAAGSCSHVLSTVCCPTL